MHSNGGGREKNQGITKITRIHPLRTMNVCTKFNENHHSILGNFWTKEADKLTNYSYSLLAHFKHRGNYKLSCLDVIL